MHTAGQEAKIILALAPLEVSFGKKLSMANLITAFRLLLTLPIVILIKLELYALALPLIVLGAISDWFDGNFARKEGKDSDLGKLLDPYVDKVFVLSILIALLEKGFVGSGVVILILFRELSISFFRSLAVQKGLIIEASNMGKVKTFLEFVAIIGLLMGLPLSSFILWLSVISAYLSAYDYIKRYMHVSVREV